MKILLTGSTGLLGSHVLNQGLELGHSFRLPVREIPRRSQLNEFINHSQVEIIKVDFQDLLSRPENFHYLFADIDLFINAMGLASSSHEDIELMNQVNFLYPQALFTMAKEQKIHSLVNISSVATMSSGEGNQMITEKNHGNFRRTPYAESKFLLDQWIDQEFNYPVLSIHPCYMLGKWDSRPSSGSVFLGLKLKKLKHFINNQKNFVAASDVATTIWKGVQKNKKGHFLVGGVNLSIETFIKISANKLKISTDDLTFFSQYDWKLYSGMLENSDRARVEEFTLSNPVDDREARVQLGHRPNENIHEIIDETLQYFADKKLIRI